MRYAILEKPKPEALYKLSCFRGAVGKTTRLAEHSQQTESIFKKR